MGTCHFKGSMTPVYLLGIPLRHAALLLSIISTNETSLFVTCFIMCDFLVYFIVTVGLKMSFCRPKHVRLSYVTNAYKNYLLTYLLGQPVNVENGSCYGVW